MNNNLIIPLGPRVLIKRVNSSNVTDSGIFIPDSAVDKSDKAEIVAVSPMHAHSLAEASPDLLPYLPKLGDHVMVPKYGGNDIIIDGAAYSLVLVEDILGLWPKAS